MKHLFFSLLLCAVLFSCKKQIKSETEESTSFEKLRSTPGIMPTRSGATSRAGNPAGDGGINYNMTEDGTYVHLAAPGTENVYFASVPLSPPPGSYTWNQYTNGEALDIATAWAGCLPYSPFVVGPDNHIWVTSTACSPATSTAWESGNGDVTRLAVEINDGVLMSSSVYPFICWAVGVDDAVYYSGWGIDQSGWYYTQWYTLSGNGEVLDIDASYGGPLYVVGINYKIYYRSGSSWVEFSGNGAAKRVAVDDNTGIVWVIGTNNRVYYRSGSSWAEYPGNGLAIDISVDNGVPYVIGTNGYVYQGNGTGWTQRN